MREKNLIFINNSVIENNSDQFSELVYHLKQNKEFNLSLIPIWQLFQINNQGEISKNEFKKYLTCVLKYLVHVLSKEDLEILAEEEIQRLLTNQQKNKQLSVNFDQFGEIFAFLACKWVENVNLLSAQVFINSILERTTNILIKDIASGEEELVNYNIQVCLKEKNQVEQNFNAVQKDLLYDQVVYYEENVVRDEKTIKEAEKNQQKTVSRIVLNFKEIIPLGFSTESYIDYLVNNQFDYQSQPEKIKHISTKKIQNLQKVFILPETCQSVIEDLKEYNEVEKAINIIAVLNKGLEQNRYTNGIIPRINIKISRPIFYELVKLKNKDEERKVNILSEFLNNQELEIDEIDRLERKREEKLKRKKREQELGEPYKKLIKKSQLDCEDYKIKLNFDLVRNVLNFQNKQENQEIIENIKNDNIIFDTTNCNKELNFQEFSSKYDQIPRDTLQPFSQDIIEYANRAPLQILVHGKPKTGKTSFCKELAKMIDIVHIEPLILIEKALNKIKDFEENPPETDEDGNPKETLPEAISKVKESLDAGKEVPAEVLLDLVNLELNHFSCLSKGFILDLPLTNRVYEFSWIDAIIKNKVQLPKIQCRYFSHIIELKQSDEEVLSFMSKVMENGEIGKEFSKFDRDALIKPKKKQAEEGEGEGEEEEEEEEPENEEDEESKKPQYERDLAFLPGNEISTIQELLQIYESKTEKKVSEFHSHLSINKHIIIPSAGLSPLELVNITKEKLGEEVEVLRPLAVKLEGGSEKDALTVEGSKVYRQWSPWQQVDPVELFEKEKVVPGKGEFACGYAGRAFLFDNEENQNKFYENPQKYLKKLPKLPKSYNIAVVGPRCAGKRTYAKKLAQQYGWKLIDIQEIIGQKLIQQRKFEMEGGHQPSNFEARANDVHLSEQEWKEFSKGKELGVKDVWPIILHQLGYKLQKKPEGWGVEKKDEDDDDEKKEEEEKKKTTKKPAKKAVKEVKKDDDERPQTPPVEDLSLKDIIQEIKEDGKTIETVKGVIIVGYPMNEEQINILKYHNIPIDKIISLVDTSEEEPGKVLNSRPGFEENYNLENELNLISTANGILKEQYGEENVKEVHIGGSIEEVYTRIRNQIDPFFIKADDEGMIRVQNDVNAEEEDNIVYGEYGPFCPVSLRDEGWLIPGKFENQEKGESIEAYVQGKRHLFYGEAEQNKFKENVNRYVQPGQRVEVPPPRVMFMGVRGAGLHTQLKLLQEKYKIPVLDFKANLQAHLVNEKINRRSDRLYNQVGFKPEEKEEIQDEEQEEGAEPKFRVIPNPEVEEESSEFDKKAHEIELTKKIFQGVREIFVNGNFYKPVPPEDETQIDPFDEKMMPIEAELNELLTESKKLPEAIFYLQVSDEEFMKRTYDTVKQGLINDYEAKKQAEREEKKRIREEAIAKRQQQIEEGVDEADLEPEPEEEEPEDPNAYQEGLDEILNAKKEELMNQKNSDQELLETLIGEFDNLGIKIIPIQCNRSIEKVQTAINFKLKGILEQRENLLEKYQAYQIKRPVQEEEEEDEENPVVDPLVYYEKSYCYKKSRFFDRNPLTLVDIPKCVQFPMIYRNRIYYFDSKQEIEAVMQQPLKYLGNKSFPTDIRNRPKVFVIGKPKVGKSTLAKLLEEKMNLVRIKPSNILEEFIFKHDYVLSEEARNCIMEGKQVSDETLVDLIIKRIQLADCVKNGFILDGFPKNRKQAEILTSRGILPTNVFSLQLDNYSIKLRAQKQQQKKKNKFNYNEIILHQHILSEENNILQTENYYLQQFNNIRFLDSKLSKWGIFDMSRKYILNTYQQRQNFARAQLTDQPVLVNDMGFTHNQILHNLGSFQNISPVGLKINRQFFRNSLYNSKLIYFDRFIYVLNGDQEVQDFIERPDLYLYQKLKNIDVPRYINLGEIVEKYPEIQMNGFCYYTLMDNQLIKGMLDIQCEYKGRIYAFSSHLKKHLFATEPQRFANVKLPDKLPVNFNKINLVKKIAKAGKCTAYLEHHLGQIVMKVLAQLGYKRLKYPTINCKETALKFIGVSLKALNPNKDESYRKKYMDKLQVFLKHCQYSETITQENNRKNISWKQADEEAFKTVSNADEIYDLVDQVSSNDPWDENEEQKYLQIKKEYKNLHSVKLQTDSDRWSSEQEEELNNKLFEYKMYLANKKERATYWQEWDEENLLKITEEFNQFMEELQNEDKEIFFKKFIR